MARRHVRPTARGRGPGGVSTVVGVAQVLSTGLVHLTRVTLVSGLQAARDVGSELRTAGRRAVKGSITAARDIGGDLAKLGRGVSAGLRRPTKPPTKATGRRRRKRSAA